VPEPDGTNNVELGRERLHNHPSAVAAVGSLPEPIRADSYQNQRLEVTFDRPTFINLTEPYSAPRALDLHYQHTYANISNTSQLMGPAFLQSVIAAGGMDAGMLLEELGRALGGWTLSGGKLLLQTGKGAAGMLKSL